MIVSQQVCSINDKRGKTMIKFLLSLFDRSLTQVKAKISWRDSEGYYIGLFRKELEHLAENFSPEEKVFAYFNYRTGWVDFRTTSHKIMAQFLSQGEVGSPHCVLFYLNPKWKIDQTAFRREVIKNLQVHRLVEKDIILTTTPLKKGMRWCEG